MQKIYNKKVDYVNFNNSNQSIILHYMIAGNL